MGLGLTTALGILGHPITQSLLPAAGSLVGNVLSGFNQRAARKWEEDIYNKYNSPSAMVRQYLDAGINPALMFGQSTPAAPTDTSAAPVVDSNTGTMADMLGQIMQLSLLEEQRDSLRATTRKENAIAAGTETENEFKPKLLAQQFEKGELDIQQARLGLDKIAGEIDLLAKSAANTEEDTRLKAAQQVYYFAAAALAGAQKGLVSTQDVIEQFNKSYRDEFGVNPDAGLAAQVFGTFRESALHVKDTGKQISDSVKSLKQRFVGLGAKVLSNVQQMNASAKSKWDAITSGMNLPSD